VCVMMLVARSMESGLVSHFSCALPNTAAPFHYHKLAHLGVMETLDPASCLDVCLLDVYSNCKMLAGCCLTSPACFISPLLFPVAPQLTLSLSCEMPGWWGGPHLWCHRSA
jgi:hypothetical protein